ncbi:hypothetical protein [Stenotrophomonas indicatrix]|uniref:hypothetical protein n=1 Tax=Stenotrophomonas indicatrix TaxID=2045451 RepID=UPI00343E6486
MLDIAEKLGNYPDKIARDLRALGLPRTRRIPTLKCHKLDAIKALLGLGLTRYAVAQRQGFPPTAVYSFCRPAARPIANLPRHPANASKLIHKT